MFHTHAGEVSWSWNSCSIGVEGVEGPHVHIFGKQQYECARSLLSYETFHAIVDDS
jgi:hypothetical protein